MTKEERLIEYRRDSILDNMENEPEIDFEDCILCNEAYDAENMKIIDAEYVCIHCINYNVSEGIDTAKMVREAKNIRDQRRKTYLERVKDFSHVDFLNNINSICNSYKNAI